MDSSTTHTVRSVMTARVLAIAPNAPLEVALRLMTESGVRHLPVIDGDRCVGLLHEADVLWTLWTHGPVARDVGVCCRTPAPMVTIDDSVTAAAARIDDSGGDAALVTDNGTLVGIITATDLVCYLAALTR